LGLRVRTGLAGPARDERPAADTRGWRSRLLRVNRRCRTGR
jgi:hypothetical protein